MEGPAVEDKVWDEVWDKVWDEVWGEDKGDTVEGVDEFIVVWNCSGIAKVGGDETFFDVDGTDGQREVFYFVGNRMKH